MRALLISTYEMGRQPFGLASPTAWLRAAGWTVACADASKEAIDEAALASADLVGFHLPMHTATRLAGPVIRKTRAINARAQVCAFGLYAPLNEAWLRSLGVDAIFGGEFEEELTRWAGSSFDGLRTSETTPHVVTGSSSDRLGTSETTPLVVTGSSFDRLGTSETTPLVVTGSSSDRLGTSETTPHVVTGSSSDRLGTSETTPLVVSPSNHERTVPRIRFLVPDRSALPPLTKYARLQLPDGSRRITGYTEASRGCRHLCRHCPVVPVYDGQFRVVPADVVLADVASQIAAGARHITFGDPDFFNGPTHAMRIVDALHAAHPDVSYDVTIKVEHLLRHRALLPRLAATGCAFVTSAVESIDDRVLALLEKGHTRADFLEAVDVCRRAGVTLVPTFVAFHPWLTLEGYCDLLDTIDALDLVDHVAPIQLAIRLLVPEGSRLLEIEEMRRHIGRFDPVTLTYRWTHTDPSVDALQEEIAGMVGTRLTGERCAIFADITALAHARAGLPVASPRPVRDRATVPFLNEPWYC